MQIVKPSPYEKVMNVRKELNFIRAPVSTERIKSLLEAYKEHEGQPPAIIRARVLEKYLLGMTIYIDENPLVGSMTKYRAGLNPMVEFGCKWMRKEAEFLCHLGKSTPFTEEDRDWINRAVDYWGPKCLWARSLEEVKRVYGGKVDPVAIAKAGVWQQVPVSDPMGKINLDYEKVLTKGLKGIIAEVESEIEKAPVSTMEGYQKRTYLNAMLISLNAAIKYAERYAALARTMAEKERDLERKAELEEIAEVCSWVPAHPARSFREAIQSFWFIHVIAHIEQVQAAIVPGRFGQYMYPFYKKDKEAGKIDQEKAIELLSFLFIKILEVGVFNAGEGFKVNSGQMAQNLALGGMTADGKDATNELEYLILETQRRVRCIQPTLSVLMHSGTPEDFLIKAAQVVRETGMGQPAFFNYERCVERLLYNHPGITLEEARDVSLNGCVQTNSSHRHDNVWEALFNCAKLVELTLNNGRDPITGVQIGPMTGDPQSFETFEQFYTALTEQIKYFMRLAREIVGLSLNICAEHFPTPFQSALVDDCIKKGKDVLGGGARYEADGIYTVAMIDVANSVAAVKKLVYDDKKITMKQLCQALAANFEGYEDIRKMCLDAPKFGNDNEYADSITRGLFKLWYDIHQIIPNHLGHSPRPEAFSVSIHVGRGYLTGALPSGRKAKIALTDGSVSAQPGTDLAGPTALAHSASKAMDTIKYGSSHLNMRFHPSALEGNEGLRKLLALVKSYFDMGGHHIQFNCLTNDILKDAQAHPDNYRDLLVRVAGFSAYFVNLDKGVQDEIISRTAHRWN